MSTTYLELGVHHFRCALRADDVLGVVSDVLTAPRMDFRGDALPFLDLRAMFGGRSSSVAPYCVAIEIEAERLLIGVDSVGQARREAIARVPVPELGLRAPGLVTEALRDRDTLWLTLEPAALAELANTRETTNLTPSEGGGYKADMTPTGEVAGSPSPVMTFHAAGTWLAVRLPQLERIATASRLWPVPLASAAHAGLYDDGESLVPVLQLSGEDRSPETPRLLAVLKGRDGRFAMSIDKAGRVSHDYRAAETEDEAPLTSARAMAAAGETFWLLDTDELTRSIQRNLFKRIH